MFPTKVHFFTPHQVYEKKVWFPVWESKVTLYYDLENIVKVKKLQRH